MMILFFRVPDIILLIWRFLPLMMYPLFLCAISFTGFLWFRQMLATLCWDSLRAAKV